jgi:hypothetical protein
MKASRIVRLAMFVMIVFGGVETALAESIYSFTTIDAPGFGYGTTQAFGINNSGQIVGSNSVGGFVYKDGSFTVAPAACGINNRGQIVGNYSGGGASCTRTAPSP